MLQTLTHYHTILKNENLKAAPDKSFFFLDSVKLLGHQIQNNHIQPLKSKIDVFIKLQPPKNRKKFKFMSNFSLFFQKIYKTYKSFIDIFFSNSEIQQILNVFKWTPELQPTFDRVKKELTDGTLRLAMPNSGKSFYVLCDASNYGVGAALLQIKSISKNGVSIGKLSSIFNYRT